jgi:hypothetical protein
VSIAVFARASMSFCSLFRTSFRFSIGPSLAFVALLFACAAFAADAPPPASSEPATKGGMDALLADDNLDDPVVPATKFFGFDQLETAYSFDHPGHWSKLSNRLELGAQGGFSESIKWKISGRFDYGAIYSLSNFYSQQVREDQRYDAQVRETFVDLGAGDVDLRIGRQQIIWGEVVGLFVADVVSAKDLRESLVQDFDLLRIPQYAARAEYFKNDIHLEGIWIPFPTVNNIGKPGSDFFPYPPAPPPRTAYVINNEVKPSEDGSKENFGLRASILRGGWDVAAFGYRSVDAQPSFFRQIVQAPVPAYVYTPRHEMITQYGATVSKDFDDFLFKAETVYTIGQNFSTTNPADGDGLVAQNYLDYILSVELPLPDDSRINAQLYQRIYKHHDDFIYPRRIESGATLFWSGKIGRLWEPQLLLVHSLNHNDWLARPKMVYNFAKEWRAVAGVDIFGGHPTGLFGQYDKQDRVYLEVRRSF